MTDSECTSKLNILNLCTALTATLIHDTTFAQRAKKRPQDFTRNRKLPFSELMLLLINQVKSSSQMALERFFDLTGKDISMKQQSFSEARQKLRWEACRELYDRIVDEIYDPKYECSTWHKFRLLAIDGTKIQLPSDPKLRVIFGAMGRGAQTPVAQASFLYDVLNDIIVDARIDSLRTDERELAKLHIARLYQLPSPAKNFLLFDRGYPSTKLFSFLHTRNIKFLMRVKRKFDPAIDALDMGVHHYGIVLDSGVTAPALVIKFVLSSGEIETLITNFVEDIFQIEAYKELYFLRWPIETKYNEIKHKLDIENFSGRTPDAIRQDFFISAYLANMVSLAGNSSRIEKNYEPDEIEMNDSPRDDSPPLIRTETVNHEKTKYRYKINKNHAIGVMRDQLIHLLLEPDPDKRCSETFRILAKISAVKIPMRPDRSVPRNPSPRDANFYHNIKSNI